MLSTEDLLAWYQRLAISARTRSVIDHIRSSDPSRLVGGGKRNVSGRYPSEKMGVTIQFESHQVELAGIFGMEFDPDVLEYYDQPPAIKLNYASAKGKRLGVLHTPDFFVTRNSCAGWEEWKTEEELEKLAKANPNRYCRDQSGAWICPPGVAYAEALGMYYRVRSSVEINPTYMRNIVYLDDFLREGSPAIANEDKEYLRRISTGIPGIQLMELHNATEGVLARDVIFGAIAIGVIHVNLHAAPLADPARVKVYPNLDFAASTNAGNAPQTSKMLSLHSGSCVIWDGRTWTVANIGDSSVALVSADHRLAELAISAFESLIRDNKVSIIPREEDAESERCDSSPLMNASKSDLDIALDRLDSVNAFLLDPKSLPGDKSKRTLQRWLSDCRQASAAHNSEIVGLLPRISARGNRTPRMPEQTFQKMQKHIEEDYENKKSKNKYASWHKLKKECEDSGIQAPGYDTFCKACNRRPVYERTMKRKGERAAYQYEVPYLRLYRDTPRHGDRPFEIAHIDHTELDIELVSEETGKNFKRPWLTIMTDAFSRRVLASWLSFDPPSYRTCMMVLRVCVKRHNRFPQIIVVDNGPEFRSTYFEALLAAHKVTKKSRPPAKARFGAVIERMFGTVNSQFIHNLRGNTKLTREVRLVTKSVNPKGLAVWTLRELTERLNQYLYEVYDQLEHPALGQTPRGAFQRGMEAGGLRLHKLIQYDRNYIFSTLPTTHKGTAMLSPGLGVKIHYIYYWSNFFNDPELEGRQIPIRYDPFNAGIAYAFVRSQWVECISEHYVEFEGRSEREIMLATQELRRKNQSHSAKRFDINAATLAKFFSSVEQTEAVLEQHAMDRELFAATHGISVTSGIHLFAEPTTSEDHSESTHAPISISDDEIEEYGEF
jgi:transposase InsO family protein